MLSKAWWELFYDTGAPEAYLLYKKALAQRGNTPDAGGRQWN